jgi:cytochrome c-type biogenesis protein CcmF
MIPELGHFALILALVLAATQAVLPLAGAARGDGVWMAMARPAAAGQFTFVAVAFAALAYSFLINDFSVENVAHNSFSQLPPVYRFTAVWGSHEGSLLLWILLLAAWTLAVAAFGRRLPADLLARVLGVMGIVSTGFLLFLLTTSSPFRRLWPVPADGADLNPLLQDPGMVAHPPMLYMGYVGFSVAFAFAVAALLAGRLDEAWARWARPWTTTAWAFLTAGVALGSWWAYYELGWGGWWFWDPTENAALMPWLSGTALVHSLAVTGRRGSLRVWTLLLAITTFALSLLGTFLVRSGVLSSVHAFAIDPARGVFILALLALVVGAPLLLFALRAGRLAGAPGFAPLSREALLLANNVLLLTAAASVLLGTLYPLFLDALGFGKISVGPPYFDTVFVPVAVPVLLLMGVGPLTRWGGDRAGDLWRRLRLAVLAGIAATVAAMLVLASWRPLAGLGLFLAAWIAATALANLIARWRAAPRGLFRRLAAPTAGFYGMTLAHLGVATVVVGISLVSAFESERQVRMAPGDTVTLAGYTLRFDGVSRVDGPNYVAARGEMEVTDGQTRPFPLHPEKRIYNASEMTMTEAAIDSGLTRDLYVSLGQPLGDGAWSVSVYHKPFVGWIWAGSILAVLGGFVTLAGGRRGRGSLVGAVLVVWLGSGAGLPPDAAAREARPLAEDPVLEERLVRLAEELRCVVCQNESLASSRADLAEDLRREVRDLLRTGKSDQEVVEFLTRRYGDFILYRPPFRPDTWLLWLGPALIAAAAAGGLLLYLRRSAAAAAAPAAEAPRAAEAAHHDLDQESRPS